MRSTPFASPSPDRRALRITILYAIGSLLWITTSDWILSVMPMFSSPDWQGAAQTVKGMLFVCLTSALLYVALSRAYRAREAESSLEFMFRHMREYAVLHLDRAGRLSAWNRGATTYTGYRRSEVPERNAAFLMCEDDEFRETFSSALEAAAATGRYEQAAWVCRRNGPRVFTNVIITPLLDKRKNMFGYAMVLQDITEKTRLQNDLESFSYSVSHDLRAPLRAIEGYAQLVARHAAHDMDSESRKQLAQIIKSSEQAHALIEDLLRYARFGRRGVRYESVDLARLIEYVLKPLALRADAVDADFQVSDALPTVRSDPALLQQMFTNLIENAIRYRSPERKLMVRFNYEATPQGYVLSISDNGIGISHDSREKAFKIFRRLQPADASKGTGIGLALVAKAAELLGGRAWVEANQVQGCTFKIYLPQVAVEDAA